MSLTMAIEPKVTPKTRNTARVIPRGEETIMDLLTKFSWDEDGASAVVPAESSVQLSSRTEPP